MTRIGRTMRLMNTQLIVIGGGLAGVEAAWAAARRGVRVRLVEMRPGRTTPAHRTGLLGELVCSNSLKSALPDSAPGLLKAELSELGSLCMHAAQYSRVPAGNALAVDPMRFASEITRCIQAHPLIEVVREELMEISAERPLVIATGPLTSPALAESLSALTGDALYFYDAIAPTVSIDSLNRDRVFLANRYGRGEGGYLNCPMNQEEWSRFYDALLQAETTPLHGADDPRFFSACMPIEELARRGPDTLRYGPFKPVGLIDPATGRRPWAALQLRQEDVHGRLWGLVGCQTRMRQGEQARVFRLIPGLERAQFCRYGAMHRNTYLNAPRLLKSTLEFRDHPGLFAAGQLTGVEGYLESAMAGLIAGWNAANLLLGRSPVSFPLDTMIGALLDYITGYAGKDFQPMNANLGILPDPADAPRKRVERHAAKAAATREAFRRYVSTLESPV